MSDPLRAPGTDDEPEVYAYASRALSGWVLLACVILGVAIVTAAQVLA